METAVQAIRTPRELPILGGHLALDFANTVDDPEGPERYDHAGTYPELVGWSARIGILGPDQADGLLDSARKHPRAASAALRKTHGLRRLLNEIFSEIAAMNNGQTATGERMPAESWTDLRPFVTDALAHAELLALGATYELTWPVTARLDAMLWPVAAAAAELLLTAPELARVKKCGGCPWLFVDQSKNHSRRWCAMEDCGTHEKIRRYVTKRAAKKRS